MRAIRHIILSVIDFFHKPFARWIDRQTFRYLASGGSGAALNTGVYWLSYHFLFHEQDVQTHLRIWPVIGAPIAAFIIAFVISTPYGFMMSRYIVFQESTLRGRVQAFRYLLTVTACLLLNFFFIPFFHYTCGIYATPSNILTNIVVALFSYMAQRFFTFRVKQDPPVAGEM